jgi:hypothetical protein
LLRQRGRHERNHRGIRDAEQVNVMRTERQSGPPMSRTNPSRPGRPLAATAVLLLAVAVALPARADTTAEATSSEGGVERSTASPRLVLEQRGLVPPPALEPLERSLALGVPHLGDTARPDPLPLISARRQAARYLTPAAEALALQGLIMGWNRYVGAARWATVTPDSVHQNLTGRWVFDNDAYFINQVGHPYQGSFPYAAARSAGLGFWTSAAFPLAASALWEVAGETEAPSINDQVTTTVGGIVLGEVLYRASDWVRGDGRNGWRTVAATLLSPMSTVNRRVLRGEPLEAPEALRLETSIGVQAEVSRPSGEQPVPATAAFGVALTHGLPGDAGFTFERPFDHFDARFAFSPSDDPSVTLRARGLMAGTDFAAGGRGAGLWGLWLGFDLESPGARRVSTSSLGLGATGRWEVARGVGLEGTAIGSAVLLGAAGVVAREPGSDRDYRFGPGAQALLDVAVTAGDRVRAGVNLRQYLVVGAGDSTGSDLLLDGAVTARVRVVGHHGLQASASRFQRTAREEGGAVAHQAGSLVLVSWVYAVDPPPPGPRDAFDDPDA